MAYYLRKGFRVGPLRLNLSKSGLGVSGGVTGARIGVGPKGPYVHGGRHGLYYRKYMTKGLGEGAEHAHGGEVRYFVDTGLTYKPQQSFPARPKPKCPLPPRRPSFIFMLLISGSLAALVGLVNMDVLFLSLGVMLFFGGLALGFRFKKQQAKARDLLQLLREGLEKRVPFVELLDKYLAGIPQDGFRLWLDYQIFSLFQYVFFEDPDYIRPEEMESLEEKVRLAPGTLEEIKAEAFSSFLESVLEDHVISRDEEKALLHLQTALRIPDQAIAEEKWMIWQLCAFRDAADEPLAEVANEIPLKNDEGCFYLSEGRLLNERIISQYQRDRVVYKEVGYDLDMEGQVCISSRRLLIHGDSSRDYSISRVEDVTLSVEDHTVHLKLKDRKSPLIFSMHDAATFAGKLKRVTDQA